MRITFLQLPWPRGAPQDNLFPPADLETRLIYGELPGVVTAPKADRASILRAYAFVHLKEEMRREALVKDWAAFVTYARHLIAFVKEHPRQAKRGYVVCRCPRPLALADNITALPWFCL